jgi:ribosomal protein S18 acetylase RimI-like enzyme
VDSENAPALALYERYGFERASAFAFGRRKGQLRRAASLRQSGSMAV